MSCIDWFHLYHDTRGIAIIYITPSLSPIRFSLLYLTKVEDYLKKKKNTQCSKLSICCINNYLPPRSSLMSPFSRHLCIGLVPFALLELRHTLKHILGPLSKWLQSQSFCCNHKGQLSPEYIKIHSQFSRYRLS